MINTKAPAISERRLTVFAILLMLVLACTAWAGSKKAAGPNGVPVVRGGKRPKPSPAGPATPVPAPTPTSEPAPAPITGTIAAIASNFDRSALIVTGYDRRGDGSHIPPSAAPDDQGAFRFICSGGQLRYDDPILYPGQPGKAHLHQFYGNTLANASSTYASLRSSGESTCSNKLNRSAYWVPAMMNAAGQVIQMDYASIYYKRNPTDELCRKVAAKGCADLPTAFRAVAGFDMSKMGQAQPESESRWRCASNQIWRNTIAESLADCGGEGQVIGSIAFGPCWNGQLDSADHRSHIVQASYGNWGYPKCDDAHPYLIPTLTQQFFWTIKKSDGEVYLSSDRMPGMAAMAGGTTLHADYMEAWDPTTRETWSRECIGKLLNCSDGELGDGTMLARGTLTYTASIRLVAAPERPVV